MPRQDKHNGIVILGCPRSGTTLLRRILGAHPNIAAPGETYLLTACARFLASDRTIDGMNVGVLNGLGFLGFEADDIYERLRTFVTRFRDEHAAREGKSRWLEKTAVDAFHVETIERIFGDHAHFICVVRHGVDVACSIDEWCYKSKSYPRELHAYIRIYPQSLLAFSHAWKDSTNAILDFAGRHPKNALVLRYEDLITEPEQTVKRLLDFVGELECDGLVRRALADGPADGFSDWKTFATDRIEPARAGRWKQLPPSTLGELAEVANPTLKRCGYEEIERHADDRDDDARRRYQMGLTLQKLRQTD